MKKKNQKKGYKFHSEVCLKSKMEKTQVNIKEDNTEHENELKFSLSQKIEAMKVLRESYDEITVIIRSLGIYQGKKGNYIKKKKSEKKVINFILKDG